MSKYEYEVIVQTNYYNSYNDLFNIQRNVMFFKSDYERAMDYFVEQVANRRELDEELRSVEYMRVKWEITLKDCISDDVYNYETNID